MGALALIQSWDLAILSWLRVCHDPIAIWSAWLVATLAWKGVFFWLLAAVLWLRGHRLIALQLAIALLIGTIEIGALKGVVLRARPDLYTSQQLNIPMPELLSTTHSFPSGHTTLAAAAVGVIAMGFGGWAAIAGYIFIVLVGIARVFQGMHWPSDIVGSVVLGAVASVIAVLVTRIKFVSNLVRSQSASKAVAAKEKTTV